MKYRFNILIDEKKYLVSDFKFEFNYDGFIRENDFISIPYGVIDIEVMKPYLIDCRKFIGNCEDAEKIFEEFDKEKNKTDLIKEIYNTKLNLVVKRENIFFDDYLFATSITHDIFRNETFFTFSIYNSEQLKKEL
jgi:hypothetical protein